MKIVFGLIFSFLTTTNLLAQNAEEYLEKGIEKAKADKLEEAIKLFSKSIELDPLNYIAWFNRGLAKSYLNLFEEALEDFEQTVKRGPMFENGYFLRGLTKMDLTDYDGALRDFSIAIELDKKFNRAYFQRGQLYYLLGNKDSACADFNIAKDLGNKLAERKVENCNDTSTSKTPTFSILRLNKTATDSEYGFTEKNPVKVGSGPDGGPSNQRAYLNLLRDEQGKVLSYKRISSCCGYESENGFMGFALLDIYEITYLDKKGKEKKAKVYISMYDYEEPLILKGFGTIGKKPE